MAEMFAGTVSVEGSNLNPIRTRAAVARLAIQLERRLRETCPFNKNPNKRGGALRQSIKATVTHAGSETTDISISVTALDYVKYVIGGTGAHVIEPRNANVLSFLWSTAARTSLVPGTGSLRRSTRMPISGYARGANDLRRLVRTSDLRKGGDQVAFKHVNHPGASANDFIPEAVAMLGPDLAVLADAVGEDLADDIARKLQTAFAGMQSVRL